MHRLRHIDSMRGFAALAVIYTHVSEYATNHDLVPSQIERFIFSIFTEYMDVGKIAVTLFFAVSGFVIPYSLFKYNRAPLFLFAISRFFRLYPAYWLSIPFGLIFLFVCYDRPITPLLVISNITMLQGFLGLPDILGLYWTLQIELAFYVICAVIFAFGKLNNAKTVTGVGLIFLAVALMFAVLRFVMEKKFPVALPLALCVMFWGLSMRNFFAEDKTHWRMPLGVLTVALVVAIPVVSFLAYNKDMGFHETWYKYTNTYFLSLALFYLLYRRIKITGAVFVYLGRISYSVYLFGLIVQEVLFRYFEKAIFVLSAHGFILLTEVITIAIAAVIYKFIEAPSIALGRRIINFYNAAPVRVLSQQTPA